MELSRSYLKNSLTILIAIAGVVAAAVAVFAEKDSGGMISYYCIGSNPFLGIYFQRYAACPIYVSLGYILLISVTLFTFGLLISFLIDTVRNSSEKVFLLSPNKPLPKDASSSRWASVKIRNISGEIVKNCFVDLVDLLDEGGKSVLQVQRKRKLLWSIGDVPREGNKDFQPDEEKVIDIATTFPDNKQVRLETQMGQESKNKGVYQVILTVYGEIEGKSKRKTSTFIMEYFGKNILTIRNKEDPQWEDIDPKPQQPKRKKPNVSMHSSS